MDSSSSNRDTVRDTVEVSKPASAIKRKKRPNWNEIGDKAEWARQLEQKNPEEYSQWLHGVRRMQEGSDLGQVEPWSPYSVRDIYYEGWHDRDFGTLLNQLGEQRDRE